MNKQITDMLEDARIELTEAEVGEAIDAIDTVLAEHGYEIEAETLEDYVEGLEEALADEELDEDLKKMVFGAWKKVKKGAKALNKQVKKKATGALRTAKRTVKHAMKDVKHGAKKQWGIAKRGAKMMAHAPKKPPKHHAVTSLTKHKAKKLKQGMAAKHGAKKYPHPKGWESVSNRTAG